MNELLKKIYEEVIYYEKDMFEAEKQIDTQINQLIEPYTNELTENDMELIKTLMYQTSLIAEQKGFLLGMKYMLKMLIMILSE